MARFEPVTSLSSRIVRAGCLLLIWSRMAPGQAALNAHELPEIAHPSLERLRTEIGETVNMALSSGRQIVYALRLRTAKIIDIRLLVGSGLPAVDEFQKELKGTQARRHAVNDPTLAKGLCGVAAPVFDIIGYSVATVNIAVAHPVSSRQTEDLYAPRVKE